MSKYVKLDDVMDALLHEQYGYLYEESIKAIPAADVRSVVRGKWVRSGEIMYCNNCKYIAFFPHKFCPNCGAKMEGNDETISI